MHLVGRNAANICLKLDLLSENVVKQREIMAVVMRDAIQAVNKRN